MAKAKVLIDNSIICSLTKVEYDDLNLLQACLPTLIEDEELSDSDKQAIEKYNSFLDKIVDKNKGKAIYISQNLKKIII